VSLLYLRQSTHGTDHARTDATYITNV